MAALVLGILSIPAAFFTFPGTILGLLAIIFGILGLRRVKARRADNKGMAIAGLVTGIIGFVLGTILLIAAIAFVSTAQDCITEFNSTGDQAQYEQCLQDSVN
ncbi:DUF4190 domain-containing protein [Modestobacter sp. VKM Ac-2986]|uniref:DUF4190 domain-containing protein n=1 Tax=Modestobacter sp. VKM Ac-2986 TaxID=3004140 RepID=UPI002F26085E